MSAVRSFLRKYWILLVIFLWVIAWANRDWLAGGPAPSPVVTDADESAEVVAAAESGPEPAVADSKPAEVPPAEVAATEVSESEVSDAVGDIAGSRPSAAAARERIEPEATTLAEASVAVAETPDAGSPDPTAVSRPEPETVPVDTPADVDQAEEATVGVAPTGEPEETHALQPAPERTDPETADAASDAPAGALASESRELAEAEAAPSVVTDPVPESRPDAVTVEPEPEAPAEAAPAAPVGDAAPKAPAEAAELLRQARSAYRARGPRAAAEVLATGIQELPVNAPERADLYGELGNFRFGAGDFHGALRAYDEALKALPTDSREPMLRRLWPIYDRYHPGGRSHLEQFR